jgi:hypothetical protein
MRVAHDKEVVGSNPTPNTGWMQALLAITLMKKTENKGSQMGHTKKIFLKKK